MVGKETSKEYVSRKLGNLRDLIHNYDRFFDPAYLADLQKKCDRMTEDVTLEVEIDLQMVKSTYEEAKNILTMKRAGEIQAKVKAQMDYWNTVCRAMFAETQVSKDALVWLEGAKSSQYDDVKKWIDQGWIILKGLNAPWGRCPCGNILKPKLIGREAKEWRVFDKCGMCHYNEKAAKAAQADTAVSHKVVKKPGSAARRSKAPKPASNGATAPAEIKGKKAAKATKK